MNRAHTTRNNLDHCSVLICLKGGDPTNSPLFDELCQAVIVPYVNDGTQCLISFLFLVYRALAIGMICDRFSAQDHDNIYLYTIYMYI